MKNPAAGRRQNGQTWTSPTHRVLTGEMWTRETLRVLMVQGHVRLGMVMVTCQRCTQGPGLMEAVTVVHAHNLHLPMAAAAATDTTTAAAASEAPAGASLHEVGAAAGATSPSVAGLEVATAELQAAPHVYKWSARTAAKAVKERPIFIVRLLATTCHDADALVVD